jgi:hypothetical protein
MKSGSMPFRVKGCHLPKRKTSLGASNAVRLERDPQTGNYVDKLKKIDQIL